MALTDNQTLVLASANPGKIREIQSILTRQSIVPQSQFNIEEADETGSTFVENAIIKARNAALHSHLPALADDSGLVVDALNGAPGVISARYAGVGASDQENLQKLLTDLESVAVEKRTARFVCVMVFMRHAHDPLPIISQGVWEGVICQPPPVIMDLAMIPFSGCQATNKPLPKCRRTLKMNSVTEHRHYTN